MNEINHKQIIINYDIWQPFKLESEKDLDDLLDLLKAKKLLKHCGNVHFTFRDIEVEEDTTVI